MDTSKAHIEIKAIEALAGQALSGLHREYPNAARHLLYEDGDARPPRERTPAFYGCFDWHSAVHGHWMLTRVHNRFPQLSAVPDINRALEQSITQENITKEVAFVESQPGFETPYGIAWLLALSAELKLSSELHHLFGILEPLTKVAVSSLSESFTRLPRPIRTGEHSQSAFSMALAFDAAGVLGDTDFQHLIAERTVEFFSEDTDAPIRFEPSGYDFLSPALAEADLMRRVFPTADFESWFEAFLPNADALRTWLTPLVSPDRTSGKLVHLNGLNLSRAWMLEGILSALPVGDRQCERREILQSAAAEHRRIGVPGAITPHYAGSHWLGTFALVCLTGPIGSDTESPNHP